MNTHRVAERKGQRAVLALALCAGALGAGQAGAGGLWIYENGTADVGLATAGYGARAQDASTVLSNPAGMTRLDGTQTVVGGQVAYADVKISLNPTANPAGGGDGGNPIGWFPGGSAFLTYSMSRDLKLGIGVAGMIGGDVQYDNSWAGRYYGTTGKVVGLSLLPSVAFRVNDKLSLGASVNAMYGDMKTEVAVNNIAPAFGDGQLKLEDSKWGWGANLGLLYEAAPGTRFGLTWNSEVKLDFDAPAQFTGIAPGLNTVLANRGLLNANVDLGVKVPQGVMGSVYHEMNSRWALLGSVGWQQWSKFGQVEVSVDSSNPTSLTTQLDFKDTWHVALGAQHKMDANWLVNFGVAYDSNFQDSNNVSPLLPVNSAWRLGVGGQKQESKTFSWGVAGEYVYGGSPSVNRQSAAPVMFGGRGDLSGSYQNSAVYFISANASWKF
jgi:long-chain fatty acid transport protein